MIDFLIDFLNSTLSKLSRSGKAIRRLSTFILIISCLMLIVPKVVDVVNFYLEHGEINLDYAIYLAPNMLIVCCMIAIFLTSLKGMAEMENENMTTKEECVMITRPITSEKAFTLLSFLGIILVCLVLTASCLVDAVASYLERGEIDFFFPALSGMMILTMITLIPYMVKVARGDTERERREARSAMVKKGGEIAALAGQLVKWAREMGNEKSMMANKDDERFPRQVKAVFSLSIYTMLHIFVLSLLCHMIMFDFYVMDKQISGGKVAYREIFTDFLFFNVSPDKGQMLADISRAWKIFIILSFFAPWLYFWSRKFNAGAVKGVFMISFFCGVIGSIFLIYLYLDTGLDIDLFWLLFLFMSSCFFGHIFSRMKIIVDGEKSGVNPGMASSFKLFFGYISALVGIFFSIASEHLHYLS